MTSQSQRRRIGFIRRRCDCDVISKHVTDSSCSDSVLPQELVISHQSAKGPHKEPNKRHMFRLDETHIDSSGNKNQVSVYVVMVVPDNLSTAETVASELWVRAQAFMADSDTFNKLTNGEP